MLALPVRKRVVGFGLVEHARSRSGPAGRQTAGAGGRVADVDLVEIALAVASWSSTMASEAKTSRVAEREAVAELGQADEDQREQRAAVPRVVKVGGKRRSRLAMVVPAGPRCGTERGILGGVR